LLPLLGSAALALLIGCGNAAALLLVRGLQRQQEYAVRSAMGMGRIALLRQVSIESLLLALLGGVFGVGLAVGIVKLFELIAGHAIPRLDNVTAGWAGWHGQPPAVKESDKTALPLRAVTENYFKLMGLPMLGTGVSFE
jgi:ABC-type antimicrobial peptide transport system permease subunit